MSQCTAEKFTCFELKFQRVYVPLGPGPTWLNFPKKWREKKAKKGGKWRINFACRAFYSCYCSSCATLLIITIDKLRRLRAPPGWYLMNSRLLRRFQSLSTDQSQPNDAVYQVQSHRASTAERLFELPNVPNVSNDYIHFQHSLDLIANCTFFVDDATR